MKKILLSLCTMLFFFQTFAFSQNMQDLMKKAEKLSYKGQLEHAKELMNEAEKTNKSQKTDDSWDMTSMLLGLIWGSIGTGYFIYGKKQSRALFLLSGIVLCVFPLMISNNLASIIIGTICCVAPFKIPN